MAGPTSPRPSHAYSCTRNCISLWNKERAVWLGYGDVEV
jgi:hypothetical protein